MSLPAPLCRRRQRGTPCAASSSIARSADTKQPHDRHAIHRLWPPRSTPAAALTRRLASAVLPATSQCPQYRFTAGDQAEEQRTAGLLPQHPRRRRQPTTGTDAVPPPPPAPAGGCVQRQRRRQQHGRGRAYLQVAAAQPDGGCGHCGCTRGRQRRPAAAHSGKLGFEPGMHACCSVANQR